MAPKKNYTKEQMVRAIEEVRKGVKVGMAAAKYGVPRITLRNKITGKSPLDCPLGPATILSNDDEKILVKWLFYMNDHHFPVTKDHLLDSVKKIIIEKKLDTCPFKDNRPGKKWFASFLKRHPEISERTAQNLTKARDEVTEDDLRDWFDSIKKYIEERGLLDALNDPNRIFNTDESAFFLQPKGGRVLVRKGEKNVYTSAADEKENLTVLLTASAAGIIAPPMIVFPYERLPTLIVNSVPPDWCIGRSDTGWMCSRTFFEFVTNVFNPWLEKNSIPKPVLFFLDGHRSHMTLHLANFCKDNGIEIIALYPNSTHLIQPMDVAIFRPLKLSWKQQITRWKIENPNKKLRKENFAPNLEIAIQKVTKETIKNGFRKSGLYPFGIDYVDLNKLKSQSRSSVQPPKFDESHLNFLESEIKNTFTSEKLNLFNQLYYMDRTNMEIALPEEDQSLYIIWAKLKHTLTNTETENVRKQVEDSVQRQQNLDASLEISSHRAQPIGIQKINEEDQTEQHAQETDHPQNIDDVTVSEGTAHLSSGTPIFEEPQSLLSNESQVNLNEKHVQETEDLQNINDIMTVTTNEFQTNLVDKTPSTSEIEKTTDLNIPSEPNPLSTEFVTPQKLTATNSDTVAVPSTSKNDMVIPSPFKRALFWPEPEVKKRRTKERIPSAITSEYWRSYMTKKEDEKKRKLEEQEKRKKERQEKKALKETNLKEKIAKVKERKAQTKKGKSKKPNIVSSSSESNDSEIEYEEESDYDESDSENISLAQLTAMREKGKYVIITYEGEYFPGIIENVDRDSVEVSTMTLSKGNTFRWPETVDKIWYRTNDIVEYIKDPVPINKRGFYKVHEMEKHLPFISGL